MELWKPPNKVVVVVVAVAVVIVIVVAVSLSALDVVDVFSDVERVDRSVRAVARVTPLKTAKLLREGEERGEWISANVCTSGKDCEHRQGGLRAQCYRSNSGGSTNSIFFCCLCACKTVECARAPRASRSCDIWYRSCMFLGGLLRTGCFLINASVKINGFVLYKL